MLITKDSYPNLPTFQTYNYAMEWFMIASNMCADGNISIKSYCETTLSESPIRMTRMEQLLFLAEVEDLIFFL